MLNCGSNADSGIRFRGHWSTIQLKQDRFNACKVLLGILIFRWIYCTMLYKKWAHLHGHFGLYSRPSSESCVLLLHLDRPHTILKKALSRTKLLWRTVHCPYCIIQKIHPKIWTLRSILLAQKRSGLMWIIERNTRYIFYVYEGTVCLTW